MKQKLAIFLDTASNSGGAYSELIYMIDKILKIQSKNNLEVLFITTSNNLNLDFIKNKYPIVQLKMNSIERFICYLRNYGNLIRRIKKFFFKNKLEKLLRQNDVDVVYFINPSQYSLYIEDTDFIITVPDVSHRENVEFPEWSKNTNFIRLEEILNKSLKRAIAVITNSSIIKDKLSKFYNVEGDRIFIISHQPSNTFKEFSEESYKPSKKYNLPKDYVFYPAMFLPHKNHKCVIDAIEILKKKSNKNISAVFCGSDKGYLSRIKNYILKKKLEKDIIILDFVDYIDLPYLYKKSLALVMPTFSGPTNIPPWEAFQLEVPVIYADIFEIRKVYRDAVYYIDPFNPKNLADAIKKIAEDETLRKKLKYNGKEILRGLNFDQEINQISEILEKNKKIKNSWLFEE